MAIEKIIKNEIGMAALYHRIISSECNFETNQQTIVIKSYADEFYRGIEKEQKADIIAKVERHAELIAKANKSEDEIAELSLLNLQELSACKIDDKSLRTIIMTIPILDDIREALYIRIKNEVADFEDSKKV